ncbi:MAG TPA: DUF6785 family protein [Planctomycetota bacterium]|nr:DUF6785 family protein [Planctomycetota bacterium]
MTDAPPNLPPTDAARDPPPGRAFSARAVLIGVGIALPLAWLATWNDFHLNNTFLFNHYLPPIVVVAMLVLTALVNPLLGRRSLRRGELAVITALLLAVGGVASSGFARFWSGVVAGPARLLERQDLPALKQRLDPPVAGHDWRWLPPGDLFLGIPPAGPIDANDPAYKAVIDGYLDGRARLAPARVEPGGTVRWRDAQGIEHHAVVAAGGTAAALIGLRAQDRAADGATVLAVEAPSPVPWSAWLMPALAWSPLLIGVVVASIALAFLVRQQWLHHERLPYPIGGVLVQLIDAPPGGLPEVLRARAFLIAAGCACAVITWRGLHQSGLVPFTIALDLDLGPLLAGAPWTDALDHGHLTHPFLYLGFIGLAFLVPVDLSFSLWAVFLGGNLLAMWLRGRGVPIDADHARQFDVGAMIAIAPLVLWLGRRWYGLVALAAIGRGRDPLARAAAPWLWAMIAALGGIALWLVLHGAPLVAALATVVGVFALLTVMARIVAELGVPYLTLPGSVNDLVHASVGFGLPATALVPLALIGMCLGSSREALLPYAANAAMVADRAGVPARRVGVAMIVVALIGAAVACASKLWHAYTGDGHCDGWWPASNELVAIDARFAGTVAVDRAGALWSYGAGAAVTGACGVARILLTWWPLHPLAIGAGLSWAGGAAWASFLAAWLVKSLVLRYGGVGLYRRLVPAAIGLIAGEAVAMCGFAVVKMVATGVFGIPMGSMDGASPG